MMLCGNIPMSTRTPSSSDYDNNNNTTGNTTSNGSNAAAKAQRQAAARTAAAKSKSKLWGPSHSFDSDDEEEGTGQLGARPRQAASGWWDTVNKAWTDLGHSAQEVVNSSTWSAAAATATTSSAPVKRSRSSLVVKKPMAGIPEEQEADEDSTDPSTQEDSHENNTNSNSNTNNQHHGTSHDGRNAASQATTSGFSSTANGNHRNMSRGSSRATWSTSPPQDNTSAAASTSPLNTSAENVANKVEEWTDLFSNACGAASPCSAQDLEELFGKQQRRHTKQQPAGLGIAPMRLDDEDEEEDDNILMHTCHTIKNTSLNLSTELKPLPELPRRQQPQQQQQVPPPPQRTLSEESPAERRRQRAAVRRQCHEDAARSVSGQSTQQQQSPAHEDFEVTSQQRVLITQPTTTSVLQSQSQLPPPSENVLQYTPPPSQQQTSDPLPLETLLVREDEAAALERSISELTMRSSYQGEVTRTNGRPAAPDQRRMAYYAVGRHHRLNAGTRSGGNRRCYFSGKLIFGGAPFYAGIVQQGLRTLVVFCLPSALGMPHNLPAFHQASAPKRRPSCGGATGSSSGTRGGLLQRSRRTLSSAASGSIQLSKSPSKLSSTINLDDMSLSIEGDIDPNWNLDKDFLLSILPNPSDEVLAEMNQRYPEQFETLPVQVRHASCWRLFVKFCFFSGLPIAEGELHYQVRPSLALELYGEEIVLSHDVMEAVNGASSAEILKLPNRKTFRYLKKHYPQQSQKLPDIVFERASWEQVKAEV